MATNSVVKRNLKILGAGFVAVVLTLVAGGIWSALLTVNLRRDSTFPWSAFVMAAILWAAWQYYSGKWWGTLESKRARGEMMRAKAVSSTVFGWSFLAGISAVVALAGLWIVLSDVIKIPGNPLPDFST